MDERARTEEALLKAIAMHATVGAAPGLSSETAKEKAELALAYVDAYVRLSSVTRVPSDPVA